MTDPRTLLAPILELHDRVRDAVVAATERQAVDALAAVDRDDEGDTIYAIESSVKTVDRAASRSPGREQPFVLVAEGLPGGSACCRGHDREHAATGGSSSIRSTARAA